MQKPAWIKIGLLRASQLDFPDGISHSTSLWSEVCSVCRSRQKCGMYFSQSIANY